MSKEFWFFLINLLLLLALGKAALSATVQQVRQCQWRTAPDACEDRFLRILGDSFVASSAMSICGFLCTCCTLGPAWELLSFLSWLRGDRPTGRERENLSRRAARRRRFWMARRLRRRLDGFFRRERGRGAQRAPRRSTSSSRRRI